MILYWLLAGTYLIAGVPVVELVGGSVVLEHLAHDEYVGVSSERVSEDGTRYQPAVAVLSRRLVGAAPVEIPLWTLWNNSNQSVSSFFSRRF